ncbi:hypothetical protein M8494_28675 [Serratia ureilytica]
MTTNTWPTGDVANEISIFLLNQVVANDGTAIVVLFTAVFYFLFYIFFIEPVFIFIKILLVFLLVVFKFYLNPFLLRLFCYCGNKGNDDPPSLLPCRKTD